MDLITNEYKDKLQAWVFAFAQTLVGPPKADARLNDVRSGRLRGLLLLFKKERPMVRTR